MRRLQNCSLDLDMEEKQNILSRFAVKLINSGHSVKSARIIIIQGITKFLHKVQLSKLEKDNIMFKPLHLDKEFKEGERQTRKYMAKMTWFRSADTKA